jgi:hypothetical protein
MTEERKPLEDVVHGDYVTVFYHGDISSIRKVDRVTKTLIVTGNTKWKKDGRQQGGRIWDCTEIASTIHADRVYIRNKRKTLEMRYFFNNKAEIMTTSDVNALWAVYQKIKTKYEDSQGE